MYYDHWEIIGEYSADILVDDKVIEEIKATRKLLEENEAQLLNYLRATEIEEIKRKAYDNRRKSDRGKPCSYNNLRKSAS